MKHYGDITKLHGWELPPVDVITGGSPCQDLSIAGRRAGLDGERSGLFLEQVRLVKEMRNATANDDIRLVKPRYMVWENVPGAFSSNQGKDFQAVLTEIARIADPECPIVPLPEKGGWNKSGCLMGEGFSIAWRVHDAQFWGVPQRRKRISLVADFAGGSAPEVLFERKGMCWDFEKGREPWKRAATDAEGSVGETSGTVMEMHPPIDAQMYENHRREARYTGPLKTAPTVVAQYGTGGNNTPLVLQVPYGISSYKSNAMMSDNPHSGIYEAKTSRTLDLNGGYPGCNQGGIAVCMDVGFLTIHEEQAGTLLARKYKDPPVVLYNKKDGSENAGTQNKVLHALWETYGEETVLKWGIAVLDALQQAEVLQSGVYESGVSGKAKNRNKLDDHSLPCSKLVAEWLLRGMRQREKCGCASQGWKSTEQRFEQSDEGMPKLSQQNTSTCEEMFDMWSKGQGIGVLQQTLYQIQEIRKSFDVQRPIVRRLTPLEAERLQGFPDGWTDIGEWTDSKGKFHKESSDSARYKALGNSLALPFWFWLMRRIAAQYVRPATLGSLFDGVGGFPYVWEKCNGKGTALWASEVDEFAIAVTKKHFGEE